MDKSLADKLQELLSDRSRPLCIVGHTHPDGDAIGSALGLYHCLKNLEFADVRVLMPDAYASFLHWMPGNDKVIIAEADSRAAGQAISNAGVLICVDFNGLSRAGLLEQHLRKSKAVKLMIDHHPEPEPGFDIYCSDVRASSTAELIYEVLEALNIHHSMDRNAAECLYAGILTDTGSFSYSCNNPRTYEIIAKIMAEGVDGAHINRLIYSTYSLNRMRLLGYCLSEKLRVIGGHRAAFISLTQDDLARFGYSEGDAEGIVNYALSIRNIDLAALFMEKEDHIKVSLRSYGDLDVNVLARKFYHGGGHKNASGGKSFLGLEEALQQFESLVKEMEGDHAEA
ncbi:MAG: bifunctional oligoribonuclease/PAP phosphatase NrnA [Bacteroidales bacterium]|nr:bifunctional oligoribonuclease/PAP phosphatase NrnA [Bacteroidales bacterium]